VSYKNMLSLESMAIPALIVSKRERRGERGEGREERGERREERGGEERGGEERERPFK
jgi:hypothetical protein